MSDVFEIEKGTKCTQTCPALGSRTATVCLPVSVSPFAVTGPVVIECCGEPEVMPSCHCKGKINGTCDFTISQKILVEVPVEFGANVNVGETYVECGCAVVTDFDDEHDGKDEDEE